ncbi:imelysin family protein [Pseudoxanthobacter sp. M-2]|uniref:imelysin family protein n=1 Tax=Pseudoxanthobacter sp. M-2 TaxID=3078754 RepID=UPI0038FD0CD3
MRRLPLLAATAAAVALTVAAVASASAADAPAPEAVVTHYADVAQAMYEDSLTTAKTLQMAIGDLLDAPSDATLAAARTAWIAARVPYQQSEGLRFGNALVDEWEGKVNAWPLDEGLIDYVDGATYGEVSEENPLYALNVIGSTKLRVGPDEIDATTISADLITGLQEAQEVEANVSMGYHAIEFLLWGQDLNGTGPGAGNRPATDYDVANCTGGNCERRRAYLVVATQLLVDDLEDMAQQWGPDGAARKDVIAKGPEGGLATILTGIGSLSYGELAGERIKLGLILHDPEEEHDCFSDNTHNSHYYDQVGMVALYTGTYTRVDGTTLEGPGLAAYAAAKAPEAATRVEQAMADTTARMTVMKETADSGKMAYDQMIGPDNAEGNQIIEDIVTALVAQTRAVEGLVSALGLTISVEGSDSLDNPAAVGAN